MSFAPTINIAVLGGGEEAATYLAAIRALHAEESVRLASGLRVLLEPALWHPDPAVVAALARRFQLGLASADPRLSIDAGDIHAVIACFVDPEQQAVALDRAIATRKLICAAPPLAPTEREARSFARRAATARLLAVIADRPPVESLRAFVTGLVERRTILRTWNEWLDGASPAPLSAREEIEHALAALPAEAVEARTRLLRVLSQLPEE
ncbi:MAG: hypothetical protein U0556_02400 [Dehalococcoidia bacterium]